MSKQRLSRRQFNTLCAAVGSPLSAISATVALPGAPAFAAAYPARTVKFRDGTIVPALGQGSAGLAGGRRTATDEEDALRTGLSLGMTLIDTAELYGGGHSEELIGRAIAGQRDRVFLVSKVLPKHATGDGVAHALASKPRPSEHRPSRPLPIALARSDHQSFRRCGGLRDPPDGGQN